jgi:hypothetical protein
MVIAFRIGWPTWGGGPFGGERRYMFILFVELQEDAANITIRDSHLLAHCVDDLRKVLLDGVLVADLTSFEDRSSIQKWPS